MHDAGERKTIASVQKALRCLEYLAKQPEPQSLAEVARGLDAPKSTALRLLDTLAEAGYVSRVPGKTPTYRVSLRLLSLSQHVLDHMDMRTIAYPYLRRYAAEVNEDIQLSVRDGIEVVFLDRADSRQPLRSNFQVGRRSPVHCTGAGKVLLAHTSGSEREELLQQVFAAGLTPFTANTITDPDHFRRELERIEAQGWAEDLNEHENGVSCVAAPVRDHTGQAVAAVSSPGATHRFTEDYRRQLAERVLAVAREISQALGASVRNRS